MSPLCLAPVTRKSRCVVIEVFVVDSPKPRIETGLLFKFLAISEFVMIIAPPPSVTKQQSLARKGDEIRPELSNSATVSDAAP